VEGDVRENGWLTRERVQVLVLIIVTALVLYLCYLIALPFLPAISWALALGVIVHPLHRRILTKVRRNNLAAGLAVLVVAALIVAPAVFVIQSIVGEIVDGAQKLKAGGALGLWETLVKRVPALAPALRWAEVNFNLDDQLQSAATGLAGRVTTIVGGSLYVLVQLGITFFVLFFLFRDRKSAVQVLRMLIPLSRTETDAVFERVSDTIYATLYGTVVVAMVQGFMGGLMFWILGLPTPLLWGAVMALLSIVPVLGAFVIWGPAAVILLVQGEVVRALVLTGWGMVAIGLIDNFLYPMLVGKRLRLHTVPVFFSVLGGIAVFGAAGLVLGPVVLAVTIALIEIWRRRTEGHRPAEKPTHSPIEPALMQK
jgi:predicted PurR-regulated permease PerM